ncbi:hypothetical protein IQ06DRAFT_374546 [Phaeosphaeriaceae sp. SRC1lsM3a]|nr:hypothetical protein IQ06DRAFT_374546 [Stagonospora sp. SRC1lsM3a]
MGENRSALNAPAKDGYLPSTLSGVAEAEAPAVPGFNTPIPAAVPKPRLPLPPLPSGSSSSNAKPVMESSPVIAKRERNTSKLGLRVGVDALSAGAAGALVAPIITMIDKGIIENASGRNTLGDSLKQSARELVLRPHRFIASKPFVLIFSLYFGTYFTANTIDTVSSTVHSTPASSTTAGTTKFLAVSTSNLALCLYKDNKFTQLFGSAGSKRPVPLPTFALFTVRDCMTIFASFNLPPLLAPKMEQHMSEGVQRYMSGASAAQFVTPAAVQLLSTPLHLLGLDLYNRPGVAVAGPDGRAARVLRDWAKSAAARMCRIIPAFGVGGVVNTKVRKRMMGGLE